jgi:hypothetical protein
MRKVKVKKQLYEFEEYVLKLEDKKKLASRFSS